ncbi:MAG: hypothetical protein ACI4EU_02910 [Butyrivibrio sp.]
MIYILSRYRKEIHMGVILTTKINGEEYVRYTDYAKLEHRNESLESEVQELQSELDTKDNLLKIKNGLCTDSKPPAVQVIIAHEINGREYISLDDFQRFIDDLN